MDDRSRPLKADADTAGPWRVDMRLQRTYTARREGAQKVVVGEEEGKEEALAPIKSLRRGLSFRVKSMGGKAPVHVLNHMGELVDRKGHRAWDMALGLQTGIRLNVEAATEDRTQPDSAAFTYTVKRKLPGSEGGAGFEFKDYAPAVFQALRRCFAVDTADYLSTLCGKDGGGGGGGGGGGLRIMGTPGKSGSLFFFSRDMRFIVKTLPKREASLLRHILPAYFQHVRQSPGTYLPRFLGLHRWRPDGGSSVRFVVMNNVFATSMPLHVRFDLKGSRLGREASAEERAKGPRAILKDLDLEARGARLRLGSRRKAALMRQVRADCHLLRSLSIMDYSLLVGVHLAAPDAPPPPPHAPDNPGCYSEGGIQAMDEEGRPLGERYFVGVIDMLMVYAPRKRLETLVRGEEASSQPPRKYAARFCGFLDSIID